MEIYDIVCGNCESHDFKSVGLKIVCSSCKQSLTDKDIENLLLLQDKNEKAKNLYKCNEDRVAEWCIAESKKQAYDFMMKQWGEVTMQEYLDEYLEDDKGGTLEEFIDEFFILEDPEKDFTIVDGGEDGNTLTMKVKEWVQVEKTIPRYLCWENF